MYTVITSSGTSAMARAALPARVAEATALGSPPAGTAFAAGAGSERHAASTRTSAAAETPTIGRRNIGDCMIPDSFSMARAVGARRTFPRYHPARAPARPPGNAAPCAGTLATVRRAALPTPGLETLGRPPHDERDPNARDHADPNAVRRGAPRLSPARSGIPPRTGGRVHRSEQ